MAPRDVEVLRARLEDITATAALLAKGLDDLHSLAYEQGAGSEVRVSGSAYPPPGVATVGDPRARSVWKRLETGIRAAELSLQALLHAAGNLLTEGQEDDQPRFGSALGEEEFRRLLDKQEQRRRRGEYTPAKAMPQPTYPNARRKGKKRR